MALNSQDLEIFDIIRDKFTLEETCKIYEDSYVSSLNNIKITEEEALKYGEALIILEGLGKLEEVREDLKKKYFREDKE